MRHLNLSISGSIPARLGRRRPSRIHLILILVLSSIFGSYLAPPVYAADPQLAHNGGRVNFVKPAQSDFVPYVSNPTASQQQWMRDHYWRMRTYAPYFDSRTSWYSTSWSYLDAYAIYPDSSVVTAHPEWILKDAAGNRLYIPFACENGTCPQYAADIGSPTWRQNWINTIKATLAAGTYKGVFIDDVNLGFQVSNGAGAHVDPIDPRTGTAMTLTSWQRYFAEFMEAVRVALPGVEIVHNQVFFHAGPDAQNNPYVQRTIKAADYIEVERGFDDTGLANGAGTYGFEMLLRWIDYIHAAGDGKRRGVVLDVQRNDLGREYNLATYFLISTGLDGLGNDGPGGGSLPDAWWSGYETDLGDPLGPRYKLANGVFRRDFAKGIVLVNQPGAPTQTINLGGSYTRLNDGTTVSSVTLGARQGMVLLNQATPPTSSNLALNRPMTASSTEASYGAALAADGNLGTRWSSLYSDPQWISVDLGATYNLSRVALKWEYAYGKAYQIQVSNDATTWTTLASTTTGDGGIDDLSGLTGSGRYVRMAGTTRGTVYGYSLWEFEVYGALAVTPTNVALNRPMTASSVQDATYFGAAMAADGNLSTRWSSTFADPQWISVDLGSLRTIKRVVLKWEYAYGKAYQIQVSNDGSTWTTLYATTTGDGGIDDLAISGSGRYVRMVGAVRGTVYGYSLWEFEVYGY